MVWRTSSETLDSKCTVPTGNNGGGNVKCRGCISSSDLRNLVFIDENMTGQLYRDILQKNLSDFVKNLNLGGKWIVQHDNDPKHRAHIVT